MLNLLKRLCLAAIMCCVLGQAMAQGAPGESACSPLSAEDQYGPYDFRTDRAQVHKVALHFTAAVESLLRGSTTTYPGPDIDYTLRAIPNHPRALLAMMRLSERDKTQQPRGSTYVMECWFERAIRFRPNDGIVRMIYSTYLNSQGRPQEANAQLEVATTYANDNALTHYNIGLHFFDLANYDRALTEAHTAMALGSTSPELREQLVRVNKWREPSLGVARKNLLMQSDLEQAASEACGGAFKLTSSQTAKCADGRTAAIAPARPASAPQETESAQAVGQ